MDNPGCMLCEIGGKGQIFEDKADEIINFVCLGLIWWELT